MGTSYSAQRTELGLAIQPSKVGHGGTFTPGSLSWQKFLAQTVSMGPIQEMGAMTNQIGGIITPTGVFKQAVMVGGQFSMYARLENTFGYLLKGLLGSASSVAGTDIDGVATTGLNTHIFRFDPTDQSAQPWMAFRQKLPGATPTGETYFDCKLASASFQVGGKGKVMAQFGFGGRDYETQSSPTFTNANTNFDLDESSADAGRGTIEFAGTKYPIMGLSMEIMNQLSLDQENIVGQYTPDDIITLSRMATLKVVYKWVDAGLHRQVSNGSATGTSFNPLPFIQNTAGAVPACKIRFEAPAVVGATSKRYAMTFRIGRSVWTEDGPIQLQGGNVLAQAYTVQVLEPAAGQDYLQIVIENGVASY